MSKSLKEKTEEDLRWLFGIIKEVNPKPELWEGTVQTIALWKVVNPYLDLNARDMLTIGCAGWLVSLARTVDEEKFSDISPYTYFQAAHIVVNPEEGESNWYEFYKKLTQTNINNE